MNETLCEIGNHIAECTTATLNQYMLFVFGILVIIWIIFCFLCFNFCIPYGRNIYRKFTVKKKTRYVTGFFSLLSFIKTN